ncbi:MAG: hypothetical protein WAV31_04775 [Candidatus Moraniibacteriota bacterium]
MSNRNKLILIIFFFLLLLVIFFRLNKALSFPDQAWKLEKGEKIKMSSEVIQKFEADRDGLTRVKILFGSSDVKPGGIFNFKLYDENCQDILREVELEITSLDSGNTVDFIFPKVKDSKNKTFYLRLKYVQKEGGKKANIFVIENLMPQNKFLSVNNEEFHGKSLAMRPAYRSSNLLKDFSELNQRMSQYKPWFLKHYFLHLIMFGFIILSIFLVLLLVLL